MNRNNLSVGIRLVCFVLSDTIHIKGGPHSWAAFQPVEKGHLSVVFFSYKERECGIMV